MGKGVRKNANLCEKDCLPIQDDGWKETFAYCDSKDKSRMVWTPQRLSTVIDSYFTWTNGSPLPKDMKLSSKVGGKNGDTDEEARRMVRRPYNILTFIARAGIDNWEKFKTRYCNESTEEGQEFIRLCAKLENYIYGNLQEGATAGIYNAKIVMGMTNVAEHVKQEVSGFDNMSDDELKEYRDNLLVQTGAGKE